MPKPAKPAEPLYFDNGVTLIETPRHPEATNGWTHVGITPAVPDVKALPLASQVRMISLGLPGMQVTRIRAYDRILSGWVRPDPKLHAKGGAR